MAALTAPTLIDGKTLVEYIAQEALPVDTPEIDARKFFEFKAERTPAEDLSSRVLLLVTPQTLDKAIQVLGIRLHSIEDISNAILFKSTKELAREFIPKMPALFTTAHKLSIFGRNCLPQLLDPTTGDNLTPETLALIHSSFIDNPTSTNRRPRGIFETRILIKMMEM